MSVFTETIQIRKKEDGSYTISVAISDEILVIKKINKSELSKLKIDIEKLLTEE